MKSIIFKELDLQKIPQTYFMVSIIKDYSDRHEKVLKSLEEDLCKFCFLGTESILRDIKDKADLLSELSIKLNTLYFLDPDYCKVHLSMIYCWDYGIDLNKSRILSTMFISLITRNNGKGLQLSISYDMIKGTSDRELSTCTLITKRSEGSYVENSSDVGIKYIFDDPPQDFIKSVIDHLSTTYTTWKP